MHFACSSISAYNEIAQLPIHGNSLSKLSKAYCIIGFSFLPFALQFLELIQVNVMLPVILCISCIGSKTHFKIQIFGPEKASLILAISKPDCLHNTLIV